MSKAELNARNAKIDRFLDELYEPKAISALVGCHVTCVYERMWYRNLHKAYLTSEEKAHIRARRAANAAPRA